MKNYNKLIDYLKSKEFEDSILYLYSEKIEKLNPKFKENNIFMTYIKALVVDIYQGLNEIDKDIFVNSIIKNGLSETEIDYLFFKLNACLANINDHIDNDSMIFFDELKPYMDKPISKSLHKYRSQIFEIISKEMCVYTIKQIKDGDYYIPDRKFHGKMSEYCLDDKEIEMIEAAHKSSLLVDIGHSLYDDVKYVAEPSILGGIMICNYITCDDAQAEIDGLGEFVFKTFKDGPMLETDIVFEDGIIMRYHKGNIVKEPYTIDELLSYVYADVAKILEELGIDESNISTMDYETLYRVLDEAAIEIVSQSDFFSQIYSKKMIDDSQEYVRSLHKIAKERNLE